MFCTKCGKELHDDDRFCAYCGAAVREVKRARYDDVVFNPPFRAEAKRRTEEILRQTETPEAPAKRESVSFDWNLDGFPSLNPKKTEEVDFNWGSVLETKRGSRPVKVEKIQPEEELFFSAPRDKDGDTKEVPAIRNHIIPSVWDELDKLEETEKADTAAGPEMPEPQDNPEFTHTFEGADEPEEKYTLTMEALERELFGDPEAEKRAMEVMEVSEPTILADALFGGAGEDLQDIINVPESTQFKKEDERFYTYNQKFDAFQQLLEQERERLRALEDSYNKNKESMEYTWVGEIFPPKPAGELQVVDIVAPSLTMAVDIVDSDEEAAEEPQAEEMPAEHSELHEEISEEEPEQPVETELKEEVPQTEAAPSKEKLRYSDVFPRGLVNDDGTGPADDAETEEKVTKTAAQTIGSIYDEFDEDDEPPKHTLAKVVITLLVILILAEGVVIGAKFLAPESKIAVFASDIMQKVINLVSGEEDGKTDPDGTTDVSGDNEADSYLDNLVAAAAADMKTIGEAAHSADLTFEKLSAYSFSEIANAEDFNDADWFTDSEGKVVTYGQSVMDALIRYYDSWQSVNKDESLVGINSLEIGEIKAGEDGFYVLCKVTYAGADGEQVEKYQTVHMKKSEETMIINEIKEDNL